MSSEKKKISENFLLSKGFVRCSDGIFRKKDSAHPNPPSGSDSQPDKKQPKRRSVKKAQRPAVCRTIAIITVRTVRPRDYDGLGASSKHYMDALRHCGLFEDDSPRFLECLCVSEPVGSFSEEETLIELFQLPIEKSSCEKHENE